MAGIGDLSKLFGKNSPAEQILLYNVVGQLLSAVMGPYLEELQRGVNSITQSTPLSPADLADMVVRHVMAQGDAEAYAKQSGVSPSDFARLVESSGEGLAPGELAEALRRGLISEGGTGPESTSFEQGIAESHMRDKWRPVVKALSMNEPTPADALDALLQGQIPHDMALDLFTRFGGDPQHFTWLFNSRGSAPTPLEAASMARRRIIPWSGQGPDAVSFEQAFLEGPWRDKWQEPYKEMSVYVPPARTVTALIKEGVLTDEQGLTIFEDNGLSPDMAKVYLASAHSQKSATHKATISSELRSVARKEFDAGHVSEAQFRHLLTQANVPADAIDNEVAAANLARQFSRHTLAISDIRKLWQDGALSDQQALDRLTGEGYPPDDAQTLLSEWKLTVSTGKPGLSTTRILQYLKAGILSPADAYDRLTGNGVKSSDAKFLVDNPTAVGGAKSKANTAADLVSAFKDGILNQDDTQAKLVQIGLTDDAAALKLQIANAQISKAKKPKQSAKSLSEAHVIEAYKQGLATEAWAEHELETLGWSVSDAQLIVAIEFTKLNSGQAPPGWTTLE